MANIASPLNMATPATSAEASTGSEGSDAGAEFEQLFSGLMNGDSDAEPTPPSQAEATGKTLPDGQAVAAEDPGSLLTQLGSLFAALTGDSSTKAPSGDDSEVATAPLTNDAPLLSSSGTSAAKASQTDAVPTEAVPTDAAEADTGLFAGLFAAAKSETDSEELGADEPDAEASAAAATAVSAGALAAFGPQAVAPEGAVADNATDSSEDDSSEDDSTEALLRAAHTGISSGVASGSDAQTNLKAGTVAPAAMGVSTKEASGLSNTLDPTAALSDDADSDIHAGDSAELSSDDAVVNKDKLAAQLASAKPELLAKVQQEPLQQSGLLSAAQAEALTGAGSTEFGHEAELQGLQSSPRADGRSPAAAAQAQATTAEAQLRQPVNADRMAPELRDRLQLMINSDKMTAEIRLDPPELGALQVRVQMNGDQANVQIVAQQGQARDLIEQALPRLREMLQQQGLQLGQTDISQQQSQQQQEGGSGQQQGSFGDGFIDAEQESISIANRSSDGGIDYYA
ncbi:flagellar hook-length control protein FliK [uncultured Ferrimonas sp.]|uniref:flagellar hook-length control protein FliK n=1 Tax=uncultured Ferrimonas sp. TaxID=432640 RepID=UPI002608750A|nr:flagellar hook-length control protein FliK [uncultured Ferrimonas sp.]